MQGPLAGMDFLPQSAEGCHIAKLLGCYEQPLQPFIEEAIANAYPTILNIGCAEGYYAVGMAFFGLFQAIFMANAGGAWDNAKKIVEVDLKAKGTPLHAATVVGDTVGDPFKDTSSVSLNPVIKFTTLFGLLAVEIAVKMETGPKLLLGGAIFLVALFFVYRSFYGMRIPVAAKTH